MSHYATVAINIYLASNLKMIQKKHIKYAKFFASSFDCSMHDGMACIRTPCEIVIIHNNNVHYYCCFVDSIAASLFV